MQRIHTASIVPTTEKSKMNSHVCRDNTTYTYLHSHLVDTSTYEFINEIDALPSGLSKIVCQQVQFGQKTLLFFRCTSTFCWWFFRHISLWVFTIIKYTQIVRWEWECSVHWFAANDGIRTARWVNENKLCKSWKFTEFGWILNRIRMYCLPIASLERRPLKQHRRNTAWQYVVWCMCVRVYSVQICDVYVCVVYVRAHLMDIADVWMNERWTYGVCVELNRWTFEDNFIFGEHFDNVHISSSVHLFTVVAMKFALHFEINLKSGIQFLMLSMCPLALHFDLFVWWKKVFA